MKTLIRTFARFIPLMLLSLLFSACGSGSSPVPYTAINNQSLFNVLKGDSPDFPGVASFIDTKVVFQGGDMFLGVPIDAAAKTLITKNVNSFLEASSPVFDAVLSPTPTGITVDASLKKITYKDAETTISWLFTGNSVVRSFTEIPLTGDLTGSSYASTWTYTYSPATGLTTATINDSTNETSLLKHTKIIASYNGTVKYTRSTVNSSLSGLTSADFTQNHTETNSSTALTWVQNGTVKMTGTTATGGNLAFDGGFSFDLPTYNTVAGLVTLANGTYGMGFASASNSYSNETNISNGTLVLKSQTDYSHFTPITNALTLRGSWTGAFTDSCSTTGAGKIDLSVLEATATWFGMSQDSSRFYGANLLIDGTGVHLKNSTLQWGDSNKVTDTTIEGTWSFGGCGGTFNVVKQL